MTLRVTTISQDLHYLVVGQSYGRVGYLGGAAHFAFSEAVRRAIADNPEAIKYNTELNVSAGCTARQYVHAIGGTAILEENAGPNGHWVNDDLTPADILSNAATAIAGYIHRPLLTVWSHGEQDATKIRTKEAAERAVVAARDVLISEIRARVSQGMPSNFPVWMDMLGPRWPDDEFGEYLLRDEMLSLFNSGCPWLFRGAEKYALQLDGTMHPGSELAYMQMGAHTGRKVAAWLVNPGFEMRGPRISAAQKFGNRVVVTISAPLRARLVRPTSPDFFGLFDSGDRRLSIMGYEWSGPVLILTAEREAASLRYPARPDSTNIRVDPDRIVRLSDPDPAERIYPGEIGLVLESTKTIGLQPARTGASHR